MDWIEILNQKTERMTRPQTRGDARHVVYGFYVIGFLYIYK